MTTSHVKNFSLPAAARGARVIADQAGQGGHIGQCPCRTGSSPKEVESGARCTSKAPRHVRNSPVFGKTSRARTQARVNRSIHRSQTWTKPLFVHSAISSAQRSAHFRRRAASAATMNRRFRYACGSGSSRPSPPMDRGVAEGSARRDCNRLGPSFLVFAPLYRVPNGRSFTPWLLPGAMASPLGGLAGNRPPAPPQSAVHAGIRGMLTALPANLRGRAGPALEPKPAQSYLHPPTKFPLARAPERTILA
jgi:hypothetical protein